MSSLSTIRSHLPSCGPTQTQGSRCGAGSVHFRSSGSQSGPMPACASAASASSHFMLLLQSLRHRSCLLSSQRRRGVAREAAKPSVAVLELVAMMLQATGAARRRLRESWRVLDRCLVHQRSVKPMQPNQIFLPASAFTTASLVFNTGTFLALCSSTSPTNWHLVSALHL